jgi:N-acetylmuramoyl-L-alanine amidase
MGVLAIAALACGCAGRARLEVSPGPAAPPATAPAAPRPQPGYGTRVDSLDAVDPEALAGKRIAIDPGHGGYFRGSRGVNGLAEADVNLSVALELERLLAARGALVFLTRRDDRDFLAPADSSLRHDLAERVRLANAFAPDLFVSVHHNADPGGAHDRNETQTYYKLGDEGQSLDAAASLHRYLKRNLGIEQNRILAGNYFVLRNSDAPAVLTEASYLTDPDVEARLALADKRRLEAEALYLGIAHFFARRAPRIEWFAAFTPAGAADTAFDEIDGPRLEARVEGPFDDAGLELDGQAVHPVRLGHGIEWHPDRPLAVGRHEARLRVALAGVGAARERRLAFTLRRRAVALRATTATGHAARLTAVRIELLDRAGLASPDSLRLRLRALRPGVAPAETVVTARDGVAFAYLRLSAAAARSGGSLARVTAAGARPPLRIATVAAPPARRDPAQPWTGWVLRMPEGVPLRGAPGTREPDRGLDWINRDGFAVLARESSGTVAAPRLPGVRAWAGDTLLPPRFVVVAGGALHGRRILIDPDGGGEDSGGMGASGTRAAFYNMDVARALASFLIAAGAEVRLARTADVATSDLERVRVGESFHADRYLRIGHRPEPPHVGYYFSSAAGRRWGERTALWLGRFGLPTPPVHEDAQYPIQQSSATALYVAVRRVDEPTAEAQMNAPGAVRTEAYALFVALLDEWGTTGAAALDSLRVLDAGGRPAAGAFVTLGGAMTLQADAGGRVRFARTEPGPLEVRVEHPRVQAREVLIDSVRGIVLTGPPRR